MSLFITIQAVVASQPKTREVQTIDGPKQVTDLFCLVVTGRAKQADGSYQDQTMAVEVAVWNGLGTSLLRDHSLDKGDRISMTCKIKGHRAYTSKDGEVKSILSLEADAQSGYPIIQKARKVDDAVAF